MAIIKCKMCGGDLNIAEGESVAECEYCGSRQTVPNQDNEKKLTLFGRANRLRLACEFDKAAGVYESIVAEFPEEAEAYWGLVLCRYGIEYVDDPRTGKKIPTCHRSSFDSVMEDQDFEQACENADAVARKVYREEAKAIEELRRGILEVSGKEAPYDIFICYKETDDKGDRTIDSVIAQDVYDALTEKGYRVFFSRITLEDKLGTEYEPYIFAALNSAKIMLVFGTDYEYFNAVWVKNEWSRFLALIASGQKKTLIPCYKNIDAYDMPQEFAKLQAQDMGKVGAMQDLMRGIEKILPHKIDDAALATQSAVSGNSSSASLLKRGYMALEDADWKKADEFFEQVLNQDAECAEAYMGKSLAELKLVSFKELVESRRVDRYEEERFSVVTDEERVKKAVQRCTIPNYLAEAAIRSHYEFNETYTSTVKYWTELKEKEKDWWSSDRNIVRACKYATGAYRQELEDGYKGLMAFFDDKISKATVQRDADKSALEQKFDKFNSDADRQVAELYASEMEHRERDYAAACKAQAEAERQEDTKALEMAANCFSQIGDFRDCKKRCDDCLRSIDVFREKHRQEEADRAEGERQKKKAEILKRIIFSALTVFAILIVVAIGIFVKSRIDKANTYKQAKAFLSEGEERKAAMLFGKIAGYKDSAERSEELWGKVSTHIGCGDYHVVGVKSDGTVVAAGHSDSGECDISDWTDIVAVAAGRNHMVGIKSDGTAVAVGSNRYGQCNASDWTNILVPEP